MHACGEPRMTLKVCAARSPPLACYWRARGTGAMGYDTLKIWSRMLCCMGSREMPCPVSREMRSCCG